MFTKPVRLKKVLVIDDDLDLLMLLERKLVQEGYDVETAASLAEAEDLISFSTPDLVLLDINVQGEDGRQLCFKLKKLEQHPPIKVIIMTGFDMDARRAFLFGADELIAKPFPYEYVLNRLSAHLFEKAEA
jgi:DNA-binding response OmpR family regulator